MTDKKYTTKEAKEIAWKAFLSQTTEKLIVFITKGCESITNTHLSTTFYSIPLEFGQVILF